MLNIHLDWRCRSGWWTPPKPVSPDTKRGLINAVDDCVGEALDHNTRLHIKLAHLHIDRGSVKMKGMEEEKKVGRTLSTVAMPKGAGFPVTDWYMRIVVGIVQINI